MKKPNYFVNECNDLNRNNWGYFADQSSQNWTLRTLSKSKFGAYEPDSDKIPLSAWFGAALVVSCIFLALFL
jgi:hypothetical protein